MEAEFTIRATLWMFRYAGGEPGYFVQLLTWDPQAYDFEQTCVLDRDETCDTDRLLTELVRFMDAHEASERAKVAA